MSASTEMGRALLIAEYSVLIEDIATHVYVCTSHFESLDMPICIKNRHNQMKDTFSIFLENEPNCVVAGDFNFDNIEEKTINISQFGFEDIVKDIPWTMPKTPEFVQWQPDKICMPVLNDEQKLKRHLIPSNV